MTHSIVFSPKIEQVLQNTIFPDLEKGRKDFDLPHTKAVVYWMKNLLSEEATVHNFKVLITAAYAHDWGYIGLFDGVDSNDPEVIKARKPMHMQRGAELITQLLTQKLATDFTPQEIADTAHLVAVHDRVEELHTEAEILLMEADTLGMLDISKVTPTFSASDNATFMKFEIYNRRLPHFMHPQAQQFAEKLAQERLAFYSN